MENCPKTLFFLGNFMTIKFGNFANFIIRNFVVIWEAPIRNSFRRVSKMVSDGPPSRGLTFRYVPPPPPFSSVQESVCYLSKTAKK